MGVIAQSSVAIGEEQSQTVGQCTRNRALACLPAMGWWVVREWPSHCILHSHYIALCNLDLNSFLENGVTICCATPSFCEEKEEELLQEWKSGNITHSLNEKEMLWHLKKQSDWQWLNATERLSWQCRRMQCPTLQISSLFLLNLRVPLLHWRPEWPIENEDSHWGRTMSIGQFHLGKLAPACSRRIGLDGASFLFADAMNALRPEMKLGSCLKMGLLQH